VFVFLLVTFATIVALKTLCSRWATDRLFVGYMGRVLEKVENPAPNHSHLSSLHTRSQVPDVQFIS